MREIAGGSQSFQSAEHADGTRMIGEEPVVETTTGELLARTGHRPWALPGAQWRGFMRWTDLAFLHWRIPAQTLKPHIPAGLELDTWQGDAWVGVVPFRMEDVRHRWLPSLPTATTFPEINVRTYVRAGDRAGVWFFSLDAASRVAVRGARFFLNLPYFDAAITLRAKGETVWCDAIRTHRGAAPARFKGAYRATSPPFRAESGSFEHWLTERYALFGRSRRGRVYMIEVHHLPWPLQTATASIDELTITRGAGIPLEGEPLAHCASRLDVIAWPPSYPVSRAVT